jgi:hypothetical protein
VGGRKRSRNIREIESVCECERGRERKIDRGIEREVNVGHETYKFSQLYNNDSDFATSY